MRTIWLVAWREYRSRVMARSFVIMAAVMFVLLVGGPVLAVTLMNRDAAKPAQIPVVDRTGWALPRLQEALAAAQPNLPLPDGDIDFQLELTPADPGRLEALRAELHADKFPGLLVLEGTTPDSFSATFWSNSTVTLGRTKSRLRPVIQNVVLTERLRGHVDPALMSAALAPVKTEYIQLSTGEESTGFAMRTIIATIFTTLMYLAVLMYAMQTFQGVLEEKASRVMEVLVAAVKPEYLMAGKVLGIGLAGLTQMVVWMSAYLVLVGLPVAGLTMILTKISWTIFVFMFLYFVLGFFFYAALYAGLGSTVSRIEDSQGVMAPLTMLVVAGQLLSTVAIQNPGSPVVVWCSLLPFFAPSLMIARLSLSSPPAWQVVLSLVVLAGSTAVTVWAGARVFRAGVLMYGARPTLGLVWRYLSRGGG